MNQPTDNRAWKVAGRGVLLVAFLASALTPIVAFDTDLWYHLRHAQYSVETGSLPGDTYFSYLEPARPFVDYYWLFQLVAYGTFQAGGYWGLIAARSLVWLLLLVGFDRLVRRGGGGGPWAALVPALFAGVLLVRTLNFRPHVFSYLFLVLLLWGLERRRTPLWLIGVGILWSNVHGVAFPVLWAVLAAYGVDTLYEMRRGGESSEPAARRWSILGATAATAVLTPHGLELLSVPFRSTAEASRIIGELAPFDVGSLLRFDLRRMTDGTSFTVLLWLLAALSIWWLADRERRARLRPSRLLLLAVGVALLVKASRLQMELALLTLPLWSDILAVRRRTSAGTARATGERWVTSTAAAAVLIALSLSFADRLERGLRLPHPLADAGNLARGVTAFLTDHGPGGRLMHPAASGGYLMWALGDRYRVHMDLELPFAFSSDDFYQLRHALFESSSLAVMLSRHRPDFVAASAQSPGFGQRLATVAPQYVQVFVDDTLVLWADGGRHTELAAAWRLRAIDGEQALADPFYMPPDLDAARSELARLAGVAPDVRLPHRLLCRIELASGRAAAAVRHARRLAELAPEEAQSHLLLGDALMSAGDVAGGRAAFGDALKLTPAGKRRPLHKRLAYVEVARQRPQAAYRHLRQAVDLHVMQTTRRDLELLASLAEEVGEIDHAKSLRALLELRREEPPP
ncbi:MAG: hypothetical protein V3T72_14825 [Thermoanaerobaculia bacterium]